MLEALQGRRGTAWSLLPPWGEVGLGLDLRPDMGKEEACREALGSSSLRTGEDTSPRPCGAQPAGQGRLLDGG